MPDTEQALIVASNRQIPVFEFNGSGRERKTAALEKSALIAKVVDHDSKVLAVRAQQELKGVISAIEKLRKELKEPLLSAGRQLDTLCATESLELEKEFGRVSNAVKEFDDAERRRVLEEERLQREELARIEREKQAELQRIADEQAAREREAQRIAAEEARKVREAQEAAAKLAAEATNKKQREAAELAKQEAIKQAAAAAVEQQKRDIEAQRLAAEAAARTAAIEEKAGDAAYCAAKPIEITAVKGQRTTTNWKIEVTEPYVLAKFHPDLVTIAPRLADIKAALNEGREIKGIKATRETVASVRLPAERKAIEV